MKLDDDWTNRARKIEAARGRLTAADRRREDRAEEKRRQSYDDLQKLKRLDDRRDRKGGRR